METGTGRVLLTGATGRVGRLLVPALRHAWPECDWRIFGRDDTPVPARAVVALWGRTSGAAEALRENEALALRAQALGHAAGADRVMHMSSIAVYDPAVHCPGETADTVHAEADGYGAAKLRMERAALGSDRGPAAVILRLANVVGADSLAPALRDGHARITRFDDGSGPRRSMIAPGDLAAIIARLVTLDRDRLPRILNVAAPVPIDMIDLARAANCVVEPAEPTATDRRLAQMDSGALRALWPDMRMAETAEAMIADWRRWSAAA